MRNGINPGKGEFWQAGCPAATTTRYIGRITSRFRLAAIGNYARADRRIIIIIIIGRTYSSISDYARGLCRVKHARYKRRVDRSRSQRRRERTKGEMEFRRERLKDSRARDFG